MRRGIFLGAAVLIAAAAAIPLWLVFDDDGDRRTAALTTDRSSGVGSLSIDGTAIGPIQSLEGCDMEADVVPMQASNDQGITYTAKHLGPVRYVPCTMEVGFVDQALFNWVQANLQGNHQKKNAEIELQSAGETRDTSVAARLTLQNALLTGFSMPELGPSMERSYYTITLTPTKILQEEPEGDSLKATTLGVSIDPAALQLQVSDFGKIAGLISIGPWSFEVATNTQVASDGQTVNLSAGKRTFGNLPMRFNPSVQDSAAPDLDDYFSTFAIEGNSGQANKKTVMIGMGSKLGAPPTLQLTLQSAGIFAAETWPRTGNIKGYKFYVERATPQP